MKTLSPDWFCTNPIDQEYKKYILLDYIKNVKGFFEEQKLYPPLSEIVYHIKNLETWNKKREFYKGQLKGLDFEKMTLIYDTPEESKEMLEINRIVDYSIKEMNNVFKYGKNIWNDIEQSLIWNIIGIVPLYKEEGYILLKLDKTINIYQYNTKRLIDSEENFIAINFDYIGQEKFTLKSFIGIKENLIKKGNLPNPLTISVECVNNYPIDESILPIIKTLSTKKILNI
jgi:hypothetical protein